MNDIREKGLEDVVLATVPLQGYRTGAERAILVDLAVLETGVERVRQAYGPVNFIPLSNDDPIILAQQPAYEDSPKFPGYMEIQSKYLAEFSKMHRAGNPCDVVTRAWFRESLDKLHSLTQGEFKD
ncbi:hypothetical protein N7532_005837 [Penicillium argentinense]|uniref:Uncharacterized protein n=1 Tax=Penicillium argentinense TaxID=1131581 RepID=A0A9W9KAT3_9EURO|nr:uncharacterized protein N7532_005837 [Penicillium argentinense]KAJ5098836.1 hypothetical protein N7532_005837 [Penicillium argentinense]